LFVFSERFHLPPKFPTQGVIDVTSIQNGFDALESWNQKKTQREGTAPLHHSLLVASAVTARLAARAAGTLYG
jgi:hypothetical protein